MLKQCYVCGCAANTLDLANNLCSSCRAPTASISALETFCDRIVDSSPICGTHVQGANIEPHVPPEHSTSTVTCTGNSVAGTGNFRTGIDAGGTGTTDTTLTMGESRSPVTFTVHQ
jgi:hypothetical protein